MPMLHDEMGNDGLADVAGLHANMGGAAVAAEAGTDDVARQQPVATVSRYLRTWRTWDGASAVCLWPYRLFVVRCLAERRRWRQRRRRRQRRRSAKLDGEPAAADEPRTVSHGYTTRGMWHAHAAYDMRHATPTRQRTFAVFASMPFVSSRTCPPWVRAVCCKIDCKVLKYSLLAVHICTGAQVRAFCAARRARVDGEAARRAQARQPAGPLAHRMSQYHDMRAYCWHEAMLAHIPCLSRFGMGCIGRSVWVACTSGNVPAACCNVSAAR